MGVTKCPRCGSYLMTDYCAKCKEDTKELGSFSTNDLKDFNLPEGFEEIFGLNKGGRK